MRRSVGVPQRRCRLPVEPDRAQLLVRGDDDLALIDCRRRLAAEGDSVNANDVDAHGTLKFTVRRRLSGKKF